jgi:hypothetical protein
MSDTFPLTKLAAAAAPCFDTADRLAVYTEMNLGAQQHAIDDAIVPVTDAESAWSALCRAGTRPRGHASPGAPDEEPCEAR